MPTVNFIIWIVVGGVLGWVINLIMGSNRQQGTVLNIAIGIAGALLAGLVLSPLLGMGTILDSGFSAGKLFVALIGVIILLVISNFFRRGIKAPRI
jgi:uncharacterized membrane protein YeaQ/YmgE (transglycosylase-associated protein family)